MRDLLLYEINELQKEYRSILKNVVDKIPITAPGVIIDTINVFWHKNRKLVQCALEYLSKPYCCYIFTAATMLDIENNEHYPFLCLGDYHIWDDPICGYLNMSQEALNDEFANKIRNVITDTINSNIKILDTFDSKILILPLRMISGIDIDLIHQNSLKMFYGLFKNPPESIEEFVNTYKTIRDIDFALRDEIKPILVFSDNDFHHQNWVDRFNHYKSTTTLPINTNSDAKIFFLAVVGFLSQALDVILTCGVYRLVPYVRYRVAFRYILNIAYNFKDDLDSNVKSWLFMFNISHILHNAFDKNKYCRIGLNKFLDKLKANEFETKLIQQLSEENICLDNINVPKTIEIINDQLSMCFPNL